MFRKTVSPLICVIATIAYGPIRAESATAAYVDSVVAILEEKGSLDGVSNPPLVFRVLHSNAIPAVYENWVYRKQNGFQKIEISFTLDNSDFLESYSLLKGKLIYATEAQRTTNEGGLLGFSVNYFVKNGQVVHVSSTGHGKTEEEGWDAQKDLSSRYKKRMKQLLIAKAARGGP